MIYFCLDAALEKVINDAYDSNTGIIPRSWEDTVLRSFVIVESTRWDPIESISDRLESLVHISYIQLMQYVQCMCSLKDIERSKDRPEVDVTSNSQQKL